MLCWGRLRAAQAYRRGAAAVLREVHSGWKLPIRG